MHEHMHRHQRPEGQAYASARSILEDTGPCLGLLDALSGVTVLVRNWALLGDQNKRKGQILAVLMEVDLGELNNSHFSACTIALKHLSFYSLFPSLS